MRSCAFVNAFYLLLGRFFGTKLHNSLSRTFHRRVHQQHEGQLLLAVRYKSHHQSALLVRQLYWQQKADRCPVDVMPCPSCYKLTYAVALGTFLLTRAHTINVQQNVHLSCFFVGSHR